MNRKGLKVIFVVALAAATLFHIDVYAHEHEPWYGDMPGHWAEQEVKTLWEEGVTNGQRATAGGEPVWYFHPNDSATRAQFGLLAARVFQLDPVHPGQQTFEDLDPAYRFYDSVRPFPYIESAAAAGIIQALSGRRFAPDDPITREHAVGILMRALGLAPFANAQPQSQQDAWLAGFADAADIDPDMRSKVALAVHLSIIRGYPDGTLRPTRRLTRAEAAAIFYRSALFRLQANPERFHPDGDGYRETTRVQLAYLANRNMSRWQVLATNDRGIPVAVLGDGTAQPPSSVSWDGTDFSGSPLPDGLYFYEGWLEDRVGQRFHAVPRPLLLERRSLTARLEPEAARTGETVTVRAWTRGGATAVYAHAGGGMHATLHPVDTSGPQRVWEGHFVLEGGADPSEEVTVEARFPGAQRQVALTLQRLDALWISGEVHPNPAPAGTTVTVRAFTPDDADGVTMQVAGGDLEELTRDAPGLWTGQYRIGVGERGSIPIVLTARRDGSERQTDLWLEVTESPLVDVVFFLSD